MESFFMQTMETVIGLCDVQDDLSHHWLHMSEGTFFHILAHIYLIPLIRSSGQIF